MKQKRDNTVTIVKAIGIILMVLGHAMPWGTPVCNVIWTFHMPLFFLMSGYCFKEKYLGDAKQFVFRKLKGIYFPFVFFSLLFLALHNVFCKIYIYDADWIYGWKDFTWHTSRIVTRMSHSEYLLSPFWFLKELFLGNIIFYFVYRLSKRLLGEKVKGLWVEWITAIGLLVLTEITCIFQFRIPYFGVTYNSVYAALFVALGYIWKKSEWNVGRWWIWVAGIVAVVLEAATVGGTAVNDRTPISMLYYTIPAALGTMVVFNMSKHINSVLSGWGKSFVLYIGNHTIFIVALHFLVFRLVAYCYIQMKGLPITRLLDSPTMQELSTSEWGIIAYTIAGVGISLLMAYVFSLARNKIVNRK